MQLFIKIWNFLATKVLVLKVYDLFLQGALLIVILLEHNIFLLLRRAADKYYVTMLIEDWAIWTVALLEFLLGALVAWLGRNRRSLALSGWLGATAISALIVLAFPFDQDNSPLVELCGGSAIPELSRYTSELRIEPQTNARVRTTFLFITLALCALAKVSIWAHGLTTLDDIEPTNGPFVYGILISIQLSLGLSGKEWLRGSANQQNWWEAHLSIAMLTLMFSILFLIFPKLNRKTDEEEEMDIPLDDSFWPSLKRVIFNRTIVLQIGALGFLNGALFRFFHYDREYMQARFHVDVLRDDLRTSRLLGSIFRPIVIIFFIMIFRVRFSLRRRDGVKAVTAARVGGIVACASAILFAAIAALGCGDPMAGYDGSTVSKLNCSVDCNCDSETHGFTPVCGLNTSLTYFSPCEAGCKTYENLNGFLLFLDCSCDPMGATRGACSLPGCHLVYTLYQVFVTLVLAIGGASMLMQGMVVLRAVPRVDKPLAIGVMLAVIALTGQLLTHIIYFAVSNETCAFFNAGRCQFNNPTLYILGIISTVFTVLSGVVSLISSRLQRLESVVEEDDDIALT